MSVDDDDKCFDTCCSSPLILQWCFPSFTSIVGWKIPFDFMSCVRQTVSPTLSTSITVDGYIRCDTNGFVLDCLTTFLMNNRILSTYCSSSCSTWTCFELRSSSLGGSTSKAWVSFSIFNFNSLDSCRSLCFFISRKREYETTVICHWSAETNNQMSI